MYLAGIFILCFSLFLYLADMTFYYFLISHRYFKRLRRNSLFIKIYFVSHAFFSMFLTGTLVPIHYFVFHNTFATIIICSLSLLWCVYSLLDNLVVLINKRTFIKLFADELKTFYYLIGIWDAVSSLLLSYFIMTLIQDYIANYTLLISVYTCLIGGFFTILAVGFTIRFYSKKNEQVPVLLLVEPNKKKSAKKTKNLKTPTQSPKIKYDKIIEASEFEELVIEPQSKNSDNKYFVLEDFYIKTENADCYFSVFKINHTIHQLTKTIYLKKDEIVKLNFKNYTIKSNAKKIKITLIVTSVSSNKYLFKTKVVFEPCPKPYNVKKGKIIDILQYEQL